MSRSRKKTPYLPMLSRNRSHKWYKQWRWSQHRAEAREAIAHGDYDNLDAPIRYDMWGDPRDGKFWMPKHEWFVKGKMRKYMRK